MLGQEIVQHAGVLHADEGAEDAEHPGRHAEVETDTVGVPGASAGAGADDHFVVSEIGHELIEQRKHCLTATVDEALPTDLDDVRIREDREDRVRLRLRQQCLIGEGAVDERAAQLRQDVVLHLCSVSISACRRLRQTDDVNGVALAERLWSIKIAKLSPTPVPELIEDVRARHRIDGDGAHAGKRFPAGDDLRWCGFAGPFGNLTATQGLTSGQAPLDDAARPLLTLARGDASLDQKLLATAPQALLEAVTVAKHTAQDQHPPRAADRATSRA